MEEREVKALLVACNTISCLIDQYRNDMSCPVLSVVEAGAETAASMPVKGVGVISTCFTHSTRCYPDSIEKLAPEKSVFSHGCPDLARLVETYVGDPAGQEILDRIFVATWTAWSTGTESSAVCWVVPTFPWWRKTFAACIQDCLLLIRQSRWSRQSETICGSRS